MTVGRNLRIDREIPIRRSHQISRGVFLRPVTVNLNFRQVRCRFHRGGSSTICTFEYGRSCSFSRLRVRTWESLPCLSSSRSEEHTSELQSRENLVCRLLLEKKN